MGLHEDRVTARDDLPHSAAPVVPPLTPVAGRRVLAARKTAAPYAARTRAYYRQLSATSVGLELAVAVIFGLFLGMWLDKKAGTTPWLLIAGVVFGFGTGMRGVWRHVAAADRAAKESEG